MTPAGLAALFQVVDIGAAQRAVGGQTVGIDLLGVKQTPKIGMITAVCALADDVEVSHKGAKIGLCGQEVLMRRIE